MLEEKATKQSLLLLLLSWLLVVIGTAAGPVTSPGPLLVPTDVLTLPTSIHNHLIGVSASCADSASAYFITHNNEVFRLVLDATTEITHSIPSYNRLTLPGDGKVFFCFSWANFLFIATSKSVVHRVDTTTVDAQNPLRVSKQIPIDTHIPAGSMGDYSIDYQNAVVYFTGDRTLVEFQLPTVAYISEVKTTFTPWAVAAGRGDYAEYIFIGENDVDVINNRSYVTKIRKSFPMKVLGTSVFSQNATIFSMIPNPINDDEVYVLASTQAGVVAIDRPHPVLKRWVRFSKSNAYSELSCFGAIGIPTDNRYGYFVSGKTTGWQLLETPEFDVISTVDNKYRPATNGSHSCVVDAANGYVYVAQGTGNDKDVVLKIHIVVDPPSHRLPPWAIVCLSAFGVVLLVFLAYFMYGCYNHKEPVNYVVTANNNNNVGVGVGVGGDDGTLPMNTTPKYDYTQLQH